MARAYEELEKRILRRKSLEALGRGALRKAVVEGDVDNGSVMSRSDCWSCKKEQTCSEIIEEMFNEYCGLMKNAAEHTVEH